MSVGLYMDVHVPGPVTRGLRLRGVDCLTAQEDGMDQAADPDMLDRSTALGRVLFTRDEDFLREAAHRQQTGITFAGVVYAHQVRVSIGTCVADLDIIAKATSSPDWVDCLEYLPL